MLDEKVKYDIQYTIFNLYMTFDTQLRILTELLKWHGKIEQLLRLLISSSD